MRTKYFNINYLPEVKIPSETIDGKRYYVTPTGNKYPSVTTILSSMSEVGIAQWRARVGEEEANRVSTQASGRGTRVHTIAEHYLRNEEDYAKDAMPANLETFNQIKEFLDSHCDEVYGNEIALYSDTLKTAGRCDLVGRIHGIRTVGDFKTSKKSKREAWIKNYFFQCTTYALMLYEMYGVWCPQICIMIATDEDGLQPIVKQTKQYVEEVRDFFEDWHSKNSQLTRA